MKGLGLLLFTVLTLTVTVSAAYSLNLFDTIVHGTLYNYGLQFSYDWATPYWTILRIIQALLGLIAVLTLTNMIYVHRKFIHAKPEVPELERKIRVSERPSEKLVKPIERPMERPTAPSLVTEPQLPSASGLVRCAHCGRTFAQPLRMLDFHADRPRMVNICPFCNEIIQPVLRHQESELLKKTSQKEKRDDQAEQERPKEEPKTVTAHAK